jgi:4-hydroxyphenylpyruvate dioxygenase-like putative hemolysin
MRPGRFSISRHKSIFYSPLKEDLGMSASEELRTRIGLPPVSQIGVVVRDVDKAVEFYSSVFGLGPFTVYEFSPEKHWYMEEPSPLTLKMGKAMWGEVEWELLQPVQGKSLHKEFLETHGEGLQHLGFKVSDYDGTYKRMLDAGFRPLMRAETYVETYQGHLKACYFDTRRVGGVIFEIIWREW